MKKQKPRLSQTSMDTLLKELDKLTRCFNYYNDLIPALKLKYTTLCNDSTHDITYEDKLDLVEEIAHFNRELSTTSEKRINLLADLDSLCEQNTKYLVAKIDRTSY